VDPTIKEGYPLWCGCNNFEGSPSIHGSIAPPAHQSGKSLFEDMIYWTKKLPKRHNAAAISEEPAAIAFCMFQIICAEWKVISTYVTTRLSQIEWELGNRDFRIGTEGMESLLAKLHHWHRTVPVYNSMLSEMQETLFQDRPLICATSKTDDTGCLSELRDDVKSASSNMKQLEQRIERIMALATAITSIEESRRATQQNQNMERLTYLVVIFAPLSFISSFFSMTSDLSMLKQTFWIYFVVSVPLIVIVFLVVNPAKFRRSLEGLFRGGQTEGRSYDGI
jgi:hypothetical protein